MANKKNLIIGIVAIILGVVVLILNFYNISSLTNIWPVFFIIPIVFIISDLISFPDLRKNKLESLIFLIELMVFFFIWANFYNYGRIDLLWPFFIIMPGVSTLVGSIYVLRIKKIISSLLLIFLGIFFCFFSSGIFQWDLLLKIWPVILIGLGIYILFIHKPRRK